MAKKPSKGSGTSRVRFIMLEAEMPEGDLTQITSAIQNALRPTSVSGPKVPRATTQVIGSNDQDNEDEDVIDAFVDEDEGASNEPAHRPSSAKPRRPAKRKVIEIDLDSEPSLGDYVEKYQPNNDQDRYLVVMAFLCENRKEIEEINADHVYTCFRKLIWPTGSKDFAWPLRKLKQVQLLEQGPNRGTYLINHIGLDKVHKLAEE